MDLFHATHASPCVQKHDQKESDGDLPVGEGRTEPVRGEQQMALQVSTPQRADTSPSHERGTERSRLLCSVLLFV